MVRILALVVVLLVVLLATFPTDARAADLYLVVDGTTAVGEVTPIGVRASRAGPVWVRAWRLTNPNALRAAGVALDRGETLGWLEPRARRTPEQRALLEAAGLRPVLVGTPFPVPANTLTEVELRLMEPGLYLVAADAGGLAAYATALVSDLGLVVKRDVDRALVWAVHRTTGRPWPGVEVTIEGGGRAWTGRTGTEGLVSLVGPIPPTAAIRASAGDQLVFGRTRAYPTPATGHRVYLHAHQPAYRPGERVEVRGIVRSVGESGLAIDPAVRACVVRLLAPDDMVRAEVEVPVSAGMGTFAAGFDTAKDAPTGDWRVVAAVQGREYEAPLTVAAYRKPAFEVVVQGAAQRILVGSPTSFDVHAAFYDGGRLANAKVTWQLLFHRVDREVFAEDELVKLFFGSERQAYQPQTLATGEGTLDAEGRLHIPVPIVDPLPSGSLTLQATVQGPDRTAVVGSGRIALSASELLLDVRTDRHVYGPEDVARVTLRAQNADGGPAVGRRGIVTVGLAPEAAPGTASEETWLHRLPFETDGRGEAVVEAPLAAPGRYAIRAVVEPGGAPQGPAVSALVHVWAAGERATPGSVGSALEVVADRDHYAVGDTARLLVLPLGGAHPVLATVERDGLLGRRVLVPGEIPPVFDLPLDERHVPNVFATFTTVDHGRLLTTTRVIRIPPRTRLLTVGVRPDAAEIRPGDTSGLTIDVTDGEDRPVPGAEVDVAVVDEALFALHADPTAPIEAFFHPPHRNAVGTESYLNWRCVGWAKPLPRAAKSVDARPAASPSAPAESVPPGMREPSTGEDAGDMAPEPMLDAEEAVEEAEGEEDASFGAVAGRGGGRAPSKNGKARRAAERVREDFRTAVFWAPALTTNADGWVRVDAVPYGDALTRWRITAHGLDASTRVGTGTSNVRTKRDVAASVTLPRFLRAGDRARIPLVLRNLTDGQVDAEWTLEAKATIDGWRRVGTFALAAHGTKVVEHEFRSHLPETVTFTASLATDAGGDAERRELPVLPRGILKVEGRTLFARDGEATLDLRIPAHAEPGSITCRVSIEPAYVQAMTSALPYLLEYPYGCTEQTLNRFVPLLAASEALAALGRPTGKETAELAAMVDAGVKRLATLQHPDGGFGWWERNATDPGMTALVVRGLSRLLAVNPDHAAARTIRDAAANALAKADASDLTTRASIVLALAAADRPTNEVLPPAGHAMGPMAQALRLRAAVAIGRPDLVTALRGRLDDEARREDGRLWWSRGDGVAPERWQDDAIETTATVLLALLEAGVRPEVLEEGARWLLEARLGGDRWRSTRDTGAAVEFLAALVKATGDLGAGERIALALDGDTVWEGTVTAETALEGAVTWDVPEDRLSADRTLGLTLVCPNGSASAGVALRYHETGPAISAADAGFAVTRQFYRLSPVEKDGKVIHERMPVTETLPAGALVECEVVVRTIRPRDYVMVTSPHAGGFEPARETGMEVPGRAVAVEARRDARDDRTMFFVAHLPEGSHTFRHTLRATHAGAFTALPAMAELMYFPDVRGNSDGELWQITAAGPVGEER